MRAILISTLAMATLLVAPEISFAKERGCAYRLAGISEARAEIARAARTGRGLPEARAALTRARVKAAEEGCIGGRRFEKRDFDDRDRRIRLGSLFDGKLFLEFRDDDFDRRKFDDRRFDKRRFDRRDRRDLRERRLERELWRERARDQRRFEQLLRIRDKRRLTGFERRELWRLRSRWKF